MSNTQLKLLADTVLIERAPKYLFLVPSKPDWVVTNANGAYALSLCDGSRNLEQVISDIAEKHSKPEEARAFLDLLISDNFFSEPAASPTNIANAIPSLRSVHLNMHADCNLKCTYCYAEERVVEGVPLFLQEYKNLIDDLATMSGSMQIAFTGGEPLLNKNTPALSRYCKEKGFYTYLLTNGLPIVRKNVADISSSFDEVRISLDGSCSKIHDLHRGNGTFDKTIEAIRLLDEEGARVRIAMTVTKHNLHDISAAARRFGSRLMFQPLFNAGNAKLNGEMAITGEEYYNALAEAENVAPMANLGPRLASLKNRGTTKCAIGDVELSISHSGDVYPCHMMHVDGFLAGNIRDQSIQQIYETSPVLQKARKLEVSARPECAECPIRLLCGGTCRARAYYLAGDLNACDAFCDYEFSAFIDGLFLSVDLKDANTISVKSNDCGACSCC